VVRFFKELFLYLCAPQWRMPVLEVEIAKGVSRANRLTYVKGALWRWFFCVLQAIPLDKPK